MKLHLQLMILASLSLNATAQKINFEGLRRTRTEYLQKVIGYKARMTLDSARLEDMAQRIRNTRLFHHVSFTKKMAGADTIVVFTCREVRSLLPILEFGATEGNQWFRLGVEDENGLGSGIRSVAYYQYNDQHSFLFKQQIPLLFKKIGVNYLFRKWSFLDQLKIDDQSQHYIYDNLSGELSLSYPFDINRNTLEAGMGMMRERYTSTMQKNAGNAPGDFVQHKLTAKIVHRLKHTDYHNAYLVTGWSNTLNIQGNYEYKIRQNYWSVYNDFSYYRLVTPKTNLAFRNRLGLARNLSPFLAPFILDNYYNIRGVGNRIERGTASFVINLETRQTLWENSTWGIQAVGFLDSGTWRKPGGQLGDVLKQENFVSFGGLGGRVIYKKAFDVILRLDYGWSIAGMGSGFVFGIGQYF